MNSEVLIENNNQVHVDNLMMNKDKEKENEENAANDDSSDDDQTDSIFRSNQVKSSQPESNSSNNSLKESKSSDINPTTKSSSSVIQHPLNTSQSNNDFNSSTLTSTLNSSIYHTATSNLASSLLSNKFLNDAAFHNDNLQNPSPNSTTNRQSILNNFNTWFSEIYSGSLFQNFLFANPFRRKESRTPAPSSPNISRSASKQAFERSTPRIVKDESLESNSSGNSDFENAKLIMGTLKPTLKKGNELIELSNFNVEIDTQETGLGHRFELYPLTSHTFCDNCSEFIWTPVVHQTMKNWNALSTKTISPFSQTLRCINCKIIIHYKCSKFLRINCQKTIDHSQIEFKDCDDLSDDEEKKEKQATNDLDILVEKINRYNARIASKGSGLGIYLLEDKVTFRGFLKVHLNLTRPINVVAGTRPPSIYDILKEDENTSRKTLTTFYMPRDTTKSLHINSKSTSVDVIKAMLKKFKMVDNHQKFALYKRFTDKDQKVILSKVNEMDYPLRLALDWLDCDEKQFVLQENDTADVNWDNFHLPELFNFLKILDREEREHMQSVKNKYKNLREEIEKLINYKEIFSDAVYV